MTDERPYEDPDIPQEALPEHRPPRKALLFWALVPILTVLVVGNVSLWLFRPYLIDSHPLLLLAVSPSTAFMVLVQDRLDSFSYYSVVIARSLFADPSYYLLGYWYGRAAIGWIKRHSPDLGELAVKLEEWFPRFGWALVAVWPHPLVMVMAGASTMRFATFIALDLAGVVVRAIGVRELGWVVEDQVNWFTEFNSRWWIWLTLLSLVYIAYLVISARRSGKGSGFQSMSDIRRELENENASDDAHSFNRRPRKDNRGDDNWTEGWPPDDK